MTDRLISVVIPILNEEQNLPELGRRLPDVLEQLGVEWRVLFVDDGSSDGSLNAIRKLNAQDARFSAISFSRNFGKEIAVAAGLKHVTGDACIIMDADLQHPPEVLATFIERWDEGYDIVYGQRMDRKADGPLYRLFANFFYKVFNFLVDSDIPKNAGDFRLLSRRAIDAMNTLSERARFNKGLYSWIGFKSVAVPYSVADRAYGESKWSVRRLISFALDGMTSFSTLPLRLSSLLGIAISAIAMVYSAGFLFSALFIGGNPPGFPTLVISVMFFAGAQLISLGIIGEYLGRVYDEVKARPLYFIAEEIGIETRGAMPDDVSDGKPARKAREAQPIETMRSK